MCLNDKTALFTVCSSREQQYYNSVHGFDFDDLLRDNLDGPRLPEEGLKSRHRKNPPVYIMREEMCSRSSEHMYVAVCKRASNILDFVGGARKIRSIFFCYT